MSLMVQVNCKENEFVDSRLNKQEVFNVANDYKMPNLEYDISQFLCVMSFKLYKVTHGYKLIL